jgi:Polysaccharide lyase
VSRTFVPVGVLLPLIALALTSQVEGGSATVRVALPTCSVNPATMIARGCSLLRADAAGLVDPERGLWGNIECASPPRQRRITKGGDPHRAADGKKQGNNAYRRLTVIDGDDFYGERCELGRNERRYGENTGSQGSGTFALYQEGEHRITFFSERYSARFPTNAPTWQVIMQMKQTQPYPDSDLGVALTLQIFGGRLRLYNFDTRKWSVPAPRKGVWVRYALDVVYSTNPATGSVKVYVDLNGDGDFLDNGEQSSRMNMPTLATDAATGAPIQDHLRVGIYHDSAIQCPPPLGCYVDLDNVQVVG